VLHGHTDERSRSLGERCSTIFDIREELLEERWIVGGGGVE